MTNIDYVTSAIDLFEESIKAGGSRPLVSVKALSAKIGYSPHYLGRLFLATCGMNLGQYILKRRLSEACVRLQNTRDPIREVAEALGWEDYSSFSRAFKKEFALTAGHIREGAPAGRPLTPRARPMSPRAAFRAREPEVRRLDALQVTGLVFFMDNTVKSFHGPWSMFQRYGQRIRGVLRPELSYQCSSWPDDTEEASQGLWILCGRETESDALQEPMFFTKTYEPSTVLSFIHEGPIESIYHTYAYIWGEYLPSSIFRPSGTFEFQRYHASRPGVEILIPVAESPGPGQSGRSAS
ncbi:MAG: helix-turn-helix domain-containing protein [Spirochaetales bacterium]|nr:helix-turn-helix domain-containing protein [Spirochaetales bacterium]